MDNCLLGLKTKKDTMKRQTLGVLLRITLCLLLGLAGIGNTNAQSKSQIPVMLLTGESTIYHPWKPTTVALEKMLNEPGIFKVDVVATPPADGDFNTFNPKFSDYKVIVLNYDAPQERWPDALKKSFEQYISEGGGLVTIHAADNSFAGWTEFNKMIGVGGWRNRNEADGPHFYYLDDKLVADTKPGSAGSHGARVPFQMKVMNANHPITKGLPSVWMHQGDELYANLRGVGENMNVLVTAYSDPENRGTGFHEPQLMALSYSKGRIFHYTPGHNVMAMASVDYIVLLQRGTEWAATGKVSQKLPGDFPTANTVTYRTDIAVLDPTYKDGLGVGPRGGAGGRGGAGVPVGTAPQPSPTEQK